MSQGSIAQTASSRGADQVFFPLATIKCEGKPAFRSQQSRDVACLLDIDPSVSSWVCMPCCLDVGGEAYLPDFAVRKPNGRLVVMDGPDRARHHDISMIDAAVRSSGQTYLRMAHEEVYGGPRLRNAKDLLRYGSHLTPLGDRIRVLAVLADVGSLTFAEALQLFRESKPIAGLSSMILRGWLTIDMDEALIGPETMVTRARD